MAVPGIYEAAVTPSREDLQNQLRAEQELNLLLQESMADLELALEDQGWARINQDGQQEFSDAGRKALRSLCRVMATANPLIKRGLLVRIGYIWGQDVQVNARAGDEAEQDVNAVVQRFREDNSKTLTGSQAQEELERALGTDGEVFLAAFTSPLTGRVQVRSTPADEITDVICNPEDRDEPWFYIRTYVQRVLEPGTLQGSTRVRGQVKTVAHPAIGYSPAAKIKNLNGAEVRWDAPILHVPVNRLDGWKRGMPDVYAAIAWARAYKDFLTDWALLTKSLSTLAWATTSKATSTAKNAAAKVRSNAQQPGGPQAGGTVSLGENQTIEAIPKSGATIDSQSGKPLAGMAAAGLGVPVTILLADPGTTGARAVAETLDPALILEMAMRRHLWQDKLDELYTYVIDQAILAPRGALRGTVRIDDWGQRVVTLAGDVEKTLEWDWPPLVDIDPVQLITALVAVADTELVPKPILLRSILIAIGIKDVDEVIAKVTDENGNWVDPNANAGDQAVQSHRRGEDDPTAAADDDPDDE